MILLSVNCVTRSLLAVHSMRYSTKSHLLYCLTCFIEIDQECLFPFSDCIMSKSISLPRLPNEIMTIIFTSTLIESKNTFCCLARCSRGIYELAMPLLYKHVELCTFPEDYCTKLEYLYPRNLTRLLLKRLDLAQYVRHFMMSDGLSHGHCKYEHEEQISAERWEICAKSFAKKLAGTRPRDSYQDGYP